jgi:hypothetical protein
VSIIPLSRALLFLAALDSLAGGLWLVLRPRDLVQWIQASPTYDVRLLVRVLGVLLLCHVPCLVLPARRLAHGLLVAPVLGRLLLVGLWGWLLFTPRLSLPAQPLGVLLVHDGLWGITLGAIWVFQADVKGEAP